jgi:hypothetical protein
MGQPIAAELVADESVGHWPDRDVRGPDELLAIVEQTRNILSGLTLSAYDLPIGSHADVFRSGMAVAMEQGRLTSLPVQSRTAAGSVALPARSAGAPRPKSLTSAPPTSWAGASR